MKSKAHNDRDGDKIRSPTPLSAPHHGAVPKWLEEISESIEHNHTMHPQKRIFSFGEGPTKKYSPVSSDVPSRVILSEIDSEFGDRRMVHTSPKYGRRSTVASQMYFKNTPKNISLTNADYLIPKFEGPLDFEEISVKDLHQIELEKSWKSLNAFQQSHKGRLDSAKRVVQPDQTIDSFRYDNSSIHSPAIIEENVPNYYRCENSDYMPLNVSHIKQMNEVQVNRILKMTGRINKSKSSNSIYHDSSKMDKKLDSKDEKENNFDSNFVKKVHEYKMNMAKENKLRDDIINELFSENEKITNRLRRRSLQNPNFYRSAEYVDSHKVFSPTRGMGKGAMKGIREYDEDPGGDVNVENFIIPELPTGKKMVIKIMSTWGDKYYVGLNGIEIFDMTGKQAKIRRIAASPSDDNVLPGFSNDPRQVTNLIDGVNRTQDDMHIWLAPFNPNESQRISIIFEKVTTIAMIRIWNYNKSRIHSYRGVKNMSITFDNELIFKGEIAKASGGILGGVESFGDTILFTTDEGILDKISKSDTSYSYLKSEPAAPYGYERPSTATVDQPERPLTGQKRSDLCNDSKRDLSKEEILLGATRLDLILESNWGHPRKIGLTGVEIIEGTDNVVNLGRDNITCNYLKRNSTLHQLFNNDNITTDPDSMWAVSFERDRDVVLTIRLNEFKYVSGLRIWNYNQNLTSSYAGVHHLKILLDGKLLKNPATNEDCFVLRRAPGNQHYDFVQEIHFAKNDADEIPRTNEIGDGAWYPDVEEYETFASLPHGFVYQFIVFSTWGDQYYCGLNGLELYNEYGQKIFLEEQNICAYPESVNALPHIEGDVRTPDKLIDGISDCQDGTHSWIAPIVGKHLNRIYVVMDQPVTVSYVKFWNYRKTPKRGVKEIGILVDDLLVYNGTLKMYSPTTDEADACQLVLFTDDKRILGENWETLLRNSNYGQDVVLLDENIRATTGGSLPNADPLMRPFTAVGSFRRAYTAFSH